MSRGMVSMTIGCTLAPRYSGVEPRLSPALALSAMDHRTASDKARFKLRAMRISLKAACALKIHLQNFLDDYNRVCVLTDSSGRNAEVSRHQSPARWWHDDACRHRVQELDHVSRQLRGSVHCQLAGKLSIEGAFHRVGDVRAHGRVFGAQCSRTVG